MNECVKWTEVGHDFKFLSDSISPSRNMEHVVFEAVVPVIRAGMFSDSSTVRI